MANLVRPQVLLLLALGCCGACDEAPQNESVPTVEESSRLQTKTRLVTTDHFSIELPQSLREIPVVEDDSPFWKFADADMTVAIEAGPYAPSFGDYLKNYPEYSEEQKSIGGETVKIVSFNYGEKSKTLSDSSKKYVIGVHFGRSDHVRNELTVQISFRSDTSRRAAFNIIESIRF